MSPTAARPGAPAHTPIAGSPGPVQSRRPTDRLGWIQRNRPALERGPGKTVGPLSAAGNRAVLPGVQSRRSKSRHGGGRRQCVALAGDRQRLAIDRARSAHKATVRDVAFSPDGMRLLAPATTASASVWDAKNGRPVSAEMRHGKWMFHAEFSPDGGRVITASHDGTARVWDARTGNRSLRRRARWATRSPFATRASAPTAAGSPRPAMMERPASGMPRPESRSRPRSSTAARCCWRGSHRTAPGC